MDSSSLRAGRTGSKEACGSRKTTDRDGPTPAPIRLRNCILGLASIKINTTAERPNRRRKRENLQENKKKVSAITPLPLNTRIALSKFTNKSPSKKEYCTPTAIKNRNLLNVRVSVPATPRNADRPHCNIFKVKRRRTGSLFRPVQVLEESQ
eukprot:CAMPEP_0167793222 /NCGR_PEP_ID=MMETSP0111_2-20121227/13041_1 /TAXON_ID=91324 /ORGANISM="Lotharella globosa, Strain CCCM811" /LENGTH=151 /DNA_ID=CAMNT_0007686317 /DNA_START=142 /DNA_END=597 /DNA_ORIENTATION=-